MERVANVRHECLPHLYRRSKDRRQGYGTQALCRLERLAAQAGMKKMRLGVFKNNMAARTLYEKQGYCVIRDRKADLMAEELFDFRWPPS